MSREKLHRTIERIVGLLAKEAYVELETLSGGVRLGAEEMKEAVANYGRKIVSLPDAGYKEVDVIEINRVNPKQWSVNVPLFTESEGRSDLTLELTLIESATPLYKVEIDNIHVL